MENINNANKALYKLNSYLKEMGGEIGEIKDLCTNNYGTVNAVIGICFDPDQLQEYISQSPQPV